MIYKVAGYLKNLQVSELNNKKQISFGMVISLKLKSFSKKIKWPDLIKLEPGRYDFIDYVEKEDQPDYLRRIIAYKNKPFKEIVYNVTDNQVFGYVVV